MSTAVNPDNPILLVDDEHDALENASLVLLSGGISNVLRCQDSREVVSILDDHEVSVLVLDLTMPYMSGEEVLQRVSEKHPDIPVLIVTGTNDLETAVRCMNIGAFDYMLKPVERSRLISAVERALEIRQLRIENTVLRNRVLTSQLDFPDAFSAIITRNDNMLKIFSYIEVISTTSNPVLITGETGVGKELLVKAVHNLSGRPGKFIATNVSGLDDSIISDSLFGHVKGAFTGADEQRAGAVESAADGTLFLDEIGDLSMASQVKLLRLLQENEYAPIGSDLMKRSTARIVAATNCNLSEKIESGEFRKDLYYRLYMHHVELPPLRDRIDDIPLLVDYFVAQAAESYAKTAPRIPSSLINLLCSYNYPGNVRELMSMIYDAVSRTTSASLATDNFSKYFTDQDALINKVSLIGGNEPVFASCLTLPTIEQAQTQLIEEALSRSDGNQSQAARVLGITPSALNQRLKRLKK